MFLKYYIMDKPIPPNTENPQENSYPRPSETDKQFNEQEEFAADDGSTTPPTGTQPTKGDDRGE